MRKQSLDFIREYKTKWGMPGKTLDVGSLCVDDQTTPRELFDSYTGCDMRDGKNVDIIVNGHDLVSKFGEKSFDMVISLDTFEHDDKFWVTVDQMRKILKPGGWMLLCVPSRRCDLHEHPSDYWRFMPSAMDLFFEGYEEYFRQVDQELIEIEDEICGWGRKPL